MNNIANDLSTLVNIEEPIYPVEKKNVLTNPFTLAKTKIISKLY